MPTPPRRYLRNVAVSLAAAAAVTLGPTACDLGSGAVEAPDAATHVHALNLASSAPLQYVDEPDSEADAGEHDAGEHDAGQERADESRADESGAPADGDELGDDETGESDEGQNRDRGGAGPGGSESSNRDRDEAREAREAREVDDGRGRARDEDEDSAFGTTEAETAAPLTNGLEILGRDCTDSELEPHDGFQNAPACVDTAFGEVSAEDRNPSMLITEFPTEVDAGEPFDLQVSTRNLVRDRFLGAAAGGYYLESSFLDENGIQRGHFHTACRRLVDLTVAPDAEPAPEFFIATQDNGGGAEPDQVVVPVTGLDEPGTYQCTVWAGDGSHRTPMMQRADQTPAVDSVRITVD
jgi:hypothetical protein